MIFARIGSGPYKSMVMKFALVCMSGPQEFLNIFYHSEQCAPTSTQPSQEMFSAKTLCAVCRAAEKTPQKYMHECVKNLVIKMECAKTISV